MVHSESCRLSTFCFLHSFRRQGSKVILMVAAALGLGTAAAVGAPMVLAAAGFSAAGLRIIMSIMMMTIMVIMTLIMMMTIHGSMNRKDQS